METPGITSGKKNAGADPALDHPKSLLAGRPVAYGFYVLSRGAGKDDRCKINVCSMEFH